jgi:hypothetical protein
MKYITIQYIGVGLLFITAAYTWTSEKADISEMPHRIGLVGRMKLPEYDLEDKIFNQTTHKPMSYLHGKQMLQTLQHVCKDIEHTDINPILLDTLSSDSEEFKNILFSAHNIRTMAYQQSLYAGSRVEYIDRDAIVDINNREDMSAKIPHVYTDVYSFNNTAWHAHELDTPDDQTPIITEYIDAQGKKNTITRYGFFHVMTYYLISPVIIPLHIQGAQSTLPAEQQEIIRTNIRNLRANLEQAVTEAAAGYLEQ